MESGKYYVISAGNNLTESMTKEQILSAITQAVEGHTISDVDTGFVEKIKEQNSAANLKFWVGTTAQYNALATKENGCFYILTDDTQFDDMEAEIADLTAFKNATVDYIVQKGTYSENLYYENYASGKYVIYGHLEVTYLNSHVLGTSIAGPSGITWRTATATAQASEDNDEYSLNAKTRFQSGGSVEERRYIQIYINYGDETFSENSRWTVFVYCVGQIE